MVTVRRLLGEYMGFDAIVNVISSGEHKIRQEFWDNQGPLRTSNRGIFLAIECAEGHGKIIYDPVEGTRPGNGRSYR